MKTEHILLDIEGTITAISFVHKILFPLSYNHLEIFLENPVNFAAVADHLAAVAKENSIKKEDPQLYLKQVINTLKQYIKEDKKDGHLKEIQGRIWKEAFERGEVKGHLYPDAFEFIIKCKLPISIYSSGSVEAQKQLLKYSAFGDLSYKIQRHYDTTIGGKKISESYKKIAEDLNLAPQQILFISDAVDEIIAAQNCQLQTRLIRRAEENLPMPPKPEDFLIINDFSQLDISK